MLINMKVGEIENELMSFGDEVRQEQRRIAFLMIEIETHDMSCMSVDQLERILEICEE